VTVVSNTSPLIALSAIGRIGILRDPAIVVERKGEPIVYQEEIIAGMQKAGRRKELLRDTALLVNNDEIASLTVQYMKHFKFPDKLYRDMYHIAFAVFYNMNYLLTWNFAHLANAHLKAQLRLFNQKNRLDIPEICSPEELNDIF
jgi:hypothetical protein